MLTKGMFTSARGDWRTPQALFDVLDAEFHFTMDIAASQSNAKCACYFDVTEITLLREWRGTCFLNPPYGRHIGDWIAKARMEAAKGATIVCLLPARTDIRWFHEHIIDRAEIRFIRGRIHFDGMGPAPFPSMIVIFRPC